MSDKEKSGKSAEIVDFSKSSRKAEERVHARREAKVNTLKSRFSAARIGGKSDTASKSRAAQKLKNLFKRPDSDPPKRH